MKRTLENCSIIKKMRILPYKEDIKMYKHPIMRFEGLGQARDLLNEWKDRLYLTDWTIDVAIDVVPDGVPPAMLADIMIIYETKTARVSFFKMSNERINAEIVKYCAEKIMVHELGHLIFDVTKPANDIYSYEYELAQHQKTEFMARSLIMAKYGLDKDWFDNIN